MWLCQIFCVVVAVSVCVLVYQGQAAGQNFLASSLFQHGNAVVHLSHLLFFNYSFFFFFFSPLLEENKTKYPRISCWHAYSINEPPFPLACLVLELLSAKTFSIYVLAICVKERWEKDHQDKKRGQIWGGKENMLWETEWEVRLLKERSGKKILLGKRMRK